MSPFPDQLLDIALVVLLVLGLATVAWLAVRIHRGRGPWRVVVVAGLVVVLVPFVGPILVMGTLAYVRTRRGRARIDALRESRRTR